MMRFVAHGIEIRIESQLLRDQRLAKCLLRLRGSRKRARSAPRRSSIRSVLGQRHLGGKSASNGSRA
jgi:hypothetical protein